MQGSGLMRLILPRQSFKCRCRRNALRVSYFSAHRASSSSLESDSGGRCSRTLSKAESSSSASSEMTSIFEKLTSSRTDCPRPGMSYRTAGSYKATLVPLHRYTYDKRAEPLDAPIVRGTVRAVGTPRATKSSMWVATCIFSRPVSEFLPLSLRRSPRIPEHFAI